jgi:hypothetical protein
MTLQFTARFAYGRLSLHNYGSVPDAPTRAVSFVTGVLSKQTSFLVYCEQKATICAQMAYTLWLSHRFLYFCSMLSFGPMSARTAKNSRKALTSELPPIILAPSSRSVFGKKSRMGGSRSRTAGPETFRRSTVGDGRRCGVGVVAVDGRTDPPRFHSAVSA